MRNKIIIFTLLLALLALPALAQDDVAGSRVSFNGFDFHYPSALGPNVNISWYPGDPVEGAGPGFSDATHIQFTLYEAFPVPESQWDSNGGIRVYGADAIAQYNFLKAQYDWLKQLVDEQPDLSTFEAPVEGDLWNALPFIPVLPHGQIIRAHAEYLESPAVSGIAYITYSNATVEPFLSHHFSYTFQGISADGNAYISATFPLETSLFPSEPSPDFDIEAFSAGLPKYLNEVTATLDNAQPEDFSPSLAELDSLIQSFSFGA